MHTGSRNNDSEPGRPDSHGFALITALLLVTVLAVLLISYFTTTAIELSSTKATADQTTGFYAAEGGLNVRGEQIRQRFDNYGIPYGAAPDQESPCISGSFGSGDFACATMSLQGRDVVTYVLPGSENNSLIIPPGEPFAGLNALENTFSVFSRAAQAAKSDEPEALLHMIFRNRLVPLFQFAVFYDKDLEILPGADMTLSGRVHVNGDLYLNTPARLDILGQVTAAVRLDDSGGNLYRYRKNQPATACEGAATVRVTDGFALEPLGCGTPDRTSALTQQHLDAWNNQVLIRQDRLVVPTVESFQVGGEYWQAADLRVGLDLTAPDPQRIKVYNTDLSENLIATARLNQACHVPIGGAAPEDPHAAYAEVGSHGRLGVQAVEWSDSFRNNREGLTINMLEVDMNALLACLNNHRIDLLGPVHPGIGTEDKGGLVLYFTVLGNQSTTFNNYGVRLRNGSDLLGVKGLTVVTDQALYIQGDYNLEANWKPASFIADSFNVLSNNFNSRGHDSRTTQNLSNRAAAQTRVNGAVLSGTDTTFCVGAQDVSFCGEGLSGPGAGDSVYNGGLENYPRLHENWTGHTLFYRGSFVSLGRPQRVRGAWTGTGGYYNAPVRNWDYDTRFNNVAQLPPMTPRASYLVQERFSRDFLEQ